MTATAHQANDVPGRVSTRNPVAARHTSSGGQSRRGRRAVQVFLAVVAVLWIFPVGYAVLASFRDYSYTAKHGYLSFGGFTLQNYKDAWAQANFSQTMLNSAIVTIPAVVLTLFLSCCVAFVVARFSFKFNLALLGLFTAANLLPPQALLITVLVQRVGHPAQQLLGPDRGQRRLPDRLLRVRAVQLHEGAAA